MILRASLIAQVVKNSPTMQETQETWVWSLGLEDALEEENGNSLPYSFFFILFYYYFFLILFYF